MTNIEQRVIEIIQKELNLKTAPNLSDELAKFNADSLDRAEIIFGLEDEFGFSIDMPDKESARKIFSTVQAVADWIAQRVPA